MAKMFDKISLDFMNAIKGVLEAKNVNKHGHDHVGKEDDDIDNDGDTDKSDKYLHNRRKAIGKSINMKKESKDDVPFEGPYRTDADRKDEYGNKVKNVAKHLAKKAMNAKAAMKEDSEQVDEMSSKMKMKLGLYGKKKKMKEEAEALDELSTDTMKSYGDKRARTVFSGGRKPGESVDAAIDRKSKQSNSLSLARTKINRVQRTGSTVNKESVEELDEKLSDEAKAAIRFAAGGGAKVKPLVKIAKMAKKPMGEEADQIDELSKGTMGRYINKAKDSIDTASYRQGNREALGGSSKPLEKKLTKRHKGISMAVDKLTKEEIEMIEAKMAGVASGSMEGDKHMCATKVFHKEWNEGTPIKTMHADPDAEGLIEWYDVMFDHGIERVMTEDMEVLQAESHMHSKKKMKEEAEELDESAKIVAHLQKRYGDNIRKSHVMSAANDFGVDASKLAKAVRTKLGKSMLDEQENDEGWYTHSQMYGSKKSEKHPKGISAAEWKSGIRWHHGKNKRINIKEEAEQIDELSTEKLLAYRKKAKAGDIPVRRGVGIDTSDEKIKKKTGVYNPNLLQRAKAKLRNEEAEDLDEARGRPKKAGQMDYTVHPRTKEKLMHNNPEHMKKIEALQKNGILEKPKTEANQHIMNQLQKAKLSMQGGSTIQFTHGSAKHVSGTHAAKLLTKYAGMKPDEKEAFQKKIGHSHEQLMKHV